MSLPASICQLVLAASGWTDLCIISISFGLFLNIVHTLMAYAVCAAAGRALISLSDKSNLDMLVKVRSL